MNMNDMILVSVDDHVIEPPDLFKNHLPAHLLDRAPKMQSTKDGNDSVDSWIFEDRVVPNFGLNAVVGRPAHEYGMEPSSYSQIREGTYDVKARIDDMNVNGILGSICFPTFPHFAGSFFLEEIDKITHLNAMREFGYDPFAVLKREECTVEALREKARHVGISARENLGGFNPSNSEGRPVTSGEVMKLFA